MSGTVDDPVKRRREVQAGSAVNATRGTRRSLETILHNVLGVQATVTESGEARWSATPGGALPGDPEPTVTVTITGGGDSVDPERLEDLVRSVAPAHVRQIVTIVSSG